MTFRLSFVSKLGYDVIEIHLKITVNTQMFESTIATPAKKDLLPHTPCARRIGKSTA